MAQTTSHAAPFMVRGESPGGRTRTRLAGLVVIALMAVSGAVVSEFHASNAKQTAIQMQPHAPFSLYPH